MATRRARHTRTRREKGTEVGKGDITDVRREKRVGLQWVQFPPGNWVAPAGSYRGGGGGKKPSEPSRQMCRLGDAASRQAVTRVNVEQASKSPMWSPTLHQYGEGRRRWG